MKLIGKVAALLVFASLATGCATTLQGYPMPYQPRTGQPNGGGVIIGTAAGGLIGSQVGRGNGATASAAIGGATGAVVGSGCRPTMRSGLGALAGGLIGSHVGQGHGRNAAAAVGAATGAVMGADCR